MNLTTPPLALASSRSGSSSPAEIERVSREFESVFAKMMISSMRQATPESSLFPGENTLYRDMYDRQLAQSLSAGKGLGLAPVIRRQLEQGNPANAGGSATTGAPTATLGAAAAEPATFHLPDPAKAPAWLPIHRHEPLQHGHRVLHASANAKVNANLNAYRTAELDLHAAAISPVQAEPVSIMDVALHNEASPSIHDNPLLPPWLPNRRLAEIDKAGNKPDDKPRTAEEFVTAIWPQAQRAAAELGISPRILVAQAALETGWGRRSIKHADGASTNNLFGIKAGGRWTGDQVTRATTEVTDGVAHRENAAFRAYGSVSQSFDDYVRLLKDNQRYQNAVAAGTDHRRFASELAKAGYATDPHYAAKLVAIAEGPTLRRALGPQADPMVAMR